MVELDMNRLVEDPFVRRLAQVLLTVVIGVLVLICVTIDVLTAVKYFGLLDGWVKGIAILLFQLLAQPFGDIFAQFLVVIGSIVPVLFATVYFTVQAAPGGGQPTVTGELNQFGKAVVIAMLVGIVAGGISLLLLSLFVVAATEIAGGPDKLAQIRGALSGILSFQAIYAVQLLGLQPK
jgi:hypothetical protein